MSSLRSFSFCLSFSLPPSLSLSLSPSLPLSLSFACSLTFSVLFSFCFHPAVIGVCHLSLSFLLGSFICIFFTNFSMEIKDTVCMALRPLGQSVCPVCVLEVTNLVSVKIVQLQVVSCTASHIKGTHSLSG